MEVSWSWLCSLHALIISCKCYAKQRVGVQVNLYQKRSSRLNSFQRNFQPKSCTYCGASPWTHAHTQRSHKTKPTGKSIVFWKPTYYSGWLHMTYLPISDYTACSSHSRTLDHNDSCTALERNWRNQAANCQWPVRCLKQLEPPSGLSGAITIT